jgi:hypothetical protein
MRTHVYKCPAPGCDAGGSSASSAVPQIASDTGLLPVVMYARSAWLCAVHHARAVELAAELVALVGDPDVVLPSLRRRTKEKSINGR